MVKGYFDESVESADGYFVFAGFVGKQRNWKAYLKLWQEAKGKYNRPIHLKSMRLNDDKAPKRFGDLLSRLGAVPSKAKLLPFAASIRVSDYANKVRGTIADITMSGYNVSLAALVITILDSRKVGKSERVEFIFENQLEFAQLRAHTFRGARQLQRYKLNNGKSRIGRDGAMAKDAILEASDYLAYALLQNLIDPNSQKSLLTSPILEASKPEHTKITAENSEGILRMLYEDDIASLPKIDRVDKAIILSHIQEVFTLRGQH